MAFLRRFNGALIAGFAMLAAALGGTQAQANPTSSYWLVVTLTSNEPDVAQTSTNPAHTRILETLNLTRETLDSADLATKQRAMTMATDIFSEAESLALKPIPMTSRTACETAGQEIVNQFTIPSQMLRATHLCIKG